MSNTKIKLSSGSEFSSLKDAVASKEFHTKDVITFLTDVTLGDPVVLEKSCSIDLGGNFLFIPIASAITIKNGAQVNMFNGKIQTLSPDQIEDALLVQGSKTQLILEAGLEIDTKGTAVHVRKRGACIIQGASIKSIGNQPTIYVDDAGSALTLDSGVVASYEKNAIVARNGSNVAVNGGRVYTESNGLVPETSYPAVIIYGKDTHMVMNNGGVFSSKTAAISVQSSGSLEMNGGEVYSCSSYFTAVEVFEANSSFIMNGGFLYCTNNSAIVCSKTGYRDIQKIQIVDGKIGAVGDVINVGGPGDHGILFSKGLVKGNVPQDQIAAGYVVSDIKDDEGYAPIILKTWTSPDDASLKFPTFESDPKISSNPLEPVPDPDVVNELPFPPTTIGGTPEEMNTSNIQLDSMENPVPFAPRGLDLDIPNSRTIPVEDESYDVAATTPVGLSTCGISDGPIPEPIPYPMPMPTPDPIPQHGPRPGRFPGPDQKYIHTIFNSSVNIKTSISIYRTPSRKMKITEWKGALRVYDGGYFGPDGNEYALVKFRLPGSGRVSTGYALVYDLSHP